MLTTYKVFMSFPLILPHICCFANEQSGLSQKSKKEQITGGRMMVQEISPTISAEAILKSKSGRSLAREDVAITSENINEFTPSHETIREATRCLEELGFTVLQSGVTLTLTGKTELFEKVFRVKPTLKKDKPTGGVIVKPKGDLVVPEAFCDIIEEVVFPEPPNFFP